MVFAEGKGEPRAVRHRAITTARPPTRRGSLNQHAATAKRAHSLLKLDRHILIESLTMNFSKPLWPNRLTTHRRRTYLTRLLCLSILLAAGCDAKTTTNSPTHPPPLTALSALGTDAGNAILAQGQLTPAKGMMSIIAAPGDRVLELDVAEGDWIKVGQRLGRLESHQAQQIQLAVAETQLKEAESKLAAEESVAQARLQVARVELRKAELKVRESIDQLERAETSGGMLDLARQRVELADNKLAQLRQAAENVNTSRLVSAGTVDQQELEVQQAKSIFNRLGKKPNRRSRRVSYRSKRPRARFVPRSWRSNLQPLLLPLNRFASKLNFFDCESQRRN